jgi:3-hydroxybutyryl-CoA dehydratase
MSTMTIASGHVIEDLAIGQQASFSKTVTEADIVKFAEVSGDDNPVHLDEAFAQTTMFKGRIAHGMLSAGFISTVIGTRLPGSGTIYMSQTLRFKAPVRIGDTVTATCTITEIIPEKRRAVLSTICKVGDTVVIEGEALVMVPARGT